LQAAAQWEPASSVDPSGVALVMEPLRGANRRKRKPERALPAQPPPVPQPLAGDWWDAFSRRLAAGTHTYTHVPPCALCP